MSLVQVSAPNGAGQYTQRCRSDFALMTRARNRHSGPFSGAGRCPQRCRSDFALLTRARNRHSEPFSGAGPQHKIGPAPFTSLTCTTHPPTCSTHSALMHHPLHPPAPPSSLMPSNNPRCKGAEDFQENIDSPYVIDQPGCGIIKSDTGS